MSTSRNKVMEAIEAWRAIGQDERVYLLNLLFPSFSQVTPKEEAAHRAALALLRAAAEPEHDAPGFCAKCGTEKRIQQPCPTCAAAEPEAKDGAPVGCGDVDRLALLLGVYLEVGRWYPDGKGGHRMSPLPDTRVYDPTSPRCSCTFEERDSECLVHPSCACCGEATIVPVRYCEACTKAGKDVRP